MAQQIKFLFWNVNKKNLTDIIVDLVALESIDVVLLAEAQNIDHIQLEIKLSSISKGRFHSRFINGDRILLLDNLNNAARKTNADRRTSDCLYNINGEDILVIGVHLRDKFSLDSEDLYDLANEHRSHIDNYHIEKTLVIGDFNMNPYEKGIIGATGFNAIMSQDEIKYNPIRKFSTQQKKFFYNPSWDAYSLSTPGTYRYSSSMKSVNPYWHVLDQVLISANLMDSYEKKSFKIIKSIGSVNLLTNMVSKVTSNEIWVPDSKKYSDHLPISFKMNI